MTAFRFVLISLFCAISVILSAQATEYHIQLDFNTEVLDAAVTYEGDFLIAGFSSERSDYGLDKAFIIKFDDSGNELWRVFVAFDLEYERIQAIRILPLPDEKFAVYVDEDGCDFLQTNQVIIFDGQGNQLSSTETDIHAWNGLYCYPTGTNSFILADNQHGIQYDLSGNQLSVTQDEPADQYALTEDGIWLVKGELAVLNDENGLAIDTFDANEDIVSINTQWPTGVLIFTQNILYRLDAFAQIVQQFSLTSTDQVVDGIPDGIGFALLYRTLSGAYYIQKLDENGQNIGIFDPRTTLTDVTLCHNGTINLLVGTNVVPQQDKSVWAYFTPDFSVGNWTNGVDLSISNIRLTNQPVSEYVGETASGEPAYSVNYSQLHVTIFNNGTVPVDFCRIKLSMPVCWIYCESFYEISTIKNDLQLYPGDSVEVYFTHVGIDCIPSPDLKNLCVWITDGEHLRDQNPENNRFCLNIDGLDKTEEQSPHALLAIFPNPADNWLRMDPAAVENKFDQYQLFDLAGKSIARGTFAGSSVNVHDLQNGGYFLRLFSSENKATATGRFIIHHE